MISLRKAIQIALYGSVLAAGGASASVQILLNPGAEDPAGCSTDPAVWTESYGAQRRQYVPGGCSSSFNAPAWVDQTPPFEGEDWMFYTGTSNNATERQDVTGIPAPIRLRSDGGLCSESIFPDLDSGFWVSGWFSTKCKDGVEGANGIHCLNSPEDYGQVRVLGSNDPNFNDPPLCDSGNLQSYRPDIGPPGSPALWEELPGDTCKDGLEGGPVPHRYRIELIGHDSQDVGPSADVVWDNIGLNLQCTGAVAAMGGRTYDTPVKTTGKQKPVRTYGGRLWAEWEGPGVGDFVLMGNYTITYQKTPGGSPLRDTCHLEPDENTTINIVNVGGGYQEATIAGLHMWCNQSGCDDTDVTLRINETPSPRGSVGLDGASCGDHNFTPAQGHLDAGNVVVEGLGAFPPP